MRRALPVLLAVAVLPALALAQGDIRGRIGNRLGGAMNDRNKDLEDAMRDEPKKQPANTPEPNAGQGAQGAWVERKLPNGRPVRLYVAHPQIAPGTKANLPALVVIQEWWGVNDDIQERTREFAGKGYYAVAVDLYDGKVAKDPKEAAALKQGLTDANALARLEVGVGLLADEAKAGNVDAARTGAIGWCMGGEQALKLAIADTRIKAVAMFYGRPVTDPAKLKAIQGPVLGIFGKEDKSIPEAVVDQLDKGLTEAKIPHEIHKYDGVGHAFASKAAKVMGAYNEQKAAEAWAVTYDWLTKTLQPTPK